MFQICKFFLEACEKKQYGHMWQCPNNGNDCQYNHCLPQGYILERDKKKEKDVNEEDQISLEEQIEIDVGFVGSSGENVQCLCSARIVL